MPTITEGGAFTGWVDQLARRHTTSLAAIAFREGLSADDAIDAVQEAFITLLALPQARGLSDTADDALSFLTVIVRNASRNLRKRHHRTRPHVPVGEVPLVDDTPSADELIVQAEVHVATLGCVQQLAEIQRQVVTLRMLEEMSATDVARALGLTPGHIAVVLHRAKSELRRCLTGEPPNRR